MPKALDNETIQKIIDIYTTENISTKEVAKRVGLKDDRTVSKYLKMNNIHIKNFSELIRTSEIEQQVVQMHTNGFSEDKIQDTVGICRKTIRKILHEYNIKTDVYDRYRNYGVDQTYFETLDTNNKVYVLGMLYADGNVSKSKHYISLALRYDDKEILEKINEDMKNERPLLYLNQSKYNYKTGINSQDQWRLHINSKKIHQDLAKWGIVPNKTHLLKYPDFLTENQHSHFLRGNIDGDGCIHAYNGHYAAVDINGTYDFCLGAKQIIEQLVGVRCSLFASKRNDRIIPTYRTSISGRLQVVKFLNWIYQDADIYMERKHNIYLRDYKDIVA